MKNVPFLLAYRYIRGSKKERSISWMVIISFISILLGSFSLAIVTAVMNGFEKETCKKLQGIHASISIDAHNQPLNWQALKKVLNEEFPEIKAITPTTTKQVIIQLPGSENISNVVALQTIDPSSHRNVVSLKKKKTPTNTQKIHLEQQLTKNSLLIGSSLAKNLSLKKDDPVNLLFIPDDAPHSRRIRFNNKEVKVAEIFHSGIDEFDNHVVYGNFDLLKDLFPESGVTRIELAVKDNLSEDALATKLKKRLKLNIYSWKDLYPALVSALQLEKYAMLFILLLIIIVASMNIMSLLFMQIIQKRSDIAILKALGMSVRSIRTIFLTMGMAISCLATISGLIVALCICFLLKRYPFIKLPDAYYVTHLPVSIEWPFFLLVFILIMVISFCATWFATYKTKNITISSVLRFEA